VVYFDQGVGTWQLEQADAVKETVTHEDTSDWIKNQRFSILPSEVKPD